MRDTRELDEAVNRLADRLRAAPQSRLRQGAAAEGLALARELAALAQRLEGAPEVRVMPDAGVFAVGDQLAVAGADLAEALRAAARGEGGPGRADGAPGGAGQVGAAPGGAEAVGPVVAGGAEAVLADALARVRAAAERAGL
ncbi:MULTISPECIES: hypothetical protein [Streptomyces]|uniref:Uncharacterized protein n=1 Tax=Streptomyces fradiae ATCC 10745 = DSM 40063 TaxID=1319510 RepID=A0A1Y2NWX3_STRFR|nr:hypothetical protein [Streptomyces fradiae]OSY52052.1 hypothetical protein BG846_02280 [Streptomyces fradiae ATCC 10745 = DSM 40063]QEV12556.1 hypothetical protein CP974_11610 [Streptomyces fradiae ATCC 10745 = DSM 40063]